ncbi:MAG: multiheme c-type cytochrome [Bryobacteraceae bacterium]
MRRSPLILLAVAGLATGQQYIGAGGCASSNCHGGTSALPESESRILGNEYSIWSVSDKHSRAYKVLEEPRSKRMAEILSIADARTDKRCTVCHAAGSPDRARSDGVSCEACHGPSEKWLGPHTQQNSHAASVAAGMIDTKNLELRAKNCLECHLGTRDRVVDHELIAAGHPDLAFELDTFSWAQPMHHREPKPAAGNTSPRLRAMAVGQATAFAEGMRLLAARASRNWPEFAELECYQCHHDLRADSWRIKRGYAGRKAGSPQVNLARLDVFRLLVAQAAPEEASAVLSAIGQVATAVSTRFGDGAAVAQAAGAAAQRGDALVARFARHDFKPETARAMVQALAGDIARIAGSGPHSAEQATMTLDALTSTFAPAAQKAIGPLYDYLEHPSTYQPDQFAALFRKVAALAN